MENHERISADFYPMISRTEIANRSKYRYSLSDLSGLGSGFAVAAASIAKAAMTAGSEEGLYHCVFPEGVTGHLAEFKDGSGVLGTIMNDSGIAAQARWIPKEGTAARLLIDPVTLAVAVAMMNINKKLDDIRETQAEILQFLQQDKESELEGSVNTLADILEQYRYNSENTLWKSGKLTAVTTIKAKAESNIIFYRKEIGNALSKQRIIHAYQGADKLKASIEKGFKYYQLSVYLSAYSSFLEVILGGNFSRGYLDHMAGKIRENSYQYQIDYSACYEQLENYMERSAQSITLSGIGKAGTLVGKTLAKVPVLSKGPVDEMLIEAGRKLTDLGLEHGKAAMKDFCENRDAGIQLFIENIDIINELSNQRVEVLFDKEQIYLCA